jgi:hypothetical protein
VKRHKKDLKQEYNRRVVTIGVFQIRNTTNDKILIASGQDLSGIMNRHRFQLQNAIHPNSTLQNDWQLFGAEKFAFEVLEELHPVDTQLAKELEFMEDMWLARLRPFGERGYNKAKLSRAEKLRRIASRRIES